MTRVESDVSQGREGGCIVVRIRIQELPAQKAVYEQAAGEGADDADTEQGRIEAELLRGAIAEAVEDQRGEVADKEDAGALAGESHRHGVVVHYLKFAVFKMWDSLRAFPCR